MILKKRQSMIQLVALVMLVILTAFWAGCKSKGTSSEYKVVDSRIWSAESSSEKTVWLDNDRVVFVSTKTLTPGPDPKFLIVWNTTTGKVEPSHQATGLVCGRSGQVFFATKDEATGKRHHYRGPIENPQEHPSPSPDMYLDGTYDCDWVPKATWSVAPLSFPYTRKLHGENHFTTAEPKTQASKGKVLYYEQPGSEGKELPIYLLSKIILYSEFLDAYVVGNGIYDPTKSERGSFQILERNGNLRDVPIPKSMLKGRQDIYLLKNGYLSDYSDGKYTATDPGDRGLWLLQGVTAHRIVVGSLHGVSISPDGCKVAFIHARNSNEYFSQKKPYRTVKFINFCKGETKL